jgi:hypothetical protein
MGSGEANGGYCDELLYWRGGAIRPALRQATIAAMQSCPSSAVSRPANAMSRCAGSRRAKR